MNNFSLKFIICSVILLNMAMAAYSQNKNDDYSWSHRFNLIKNLHYGEHDEQRVDVFVQGEWIGEPTYFKADMTPKPTLVFFHGGGWVQGNKESKISYLLPYLMRGWNVVNVEYRKGVATAPNAALDALQALKWVTDNADKYYFNLDRIVLSGESAGGHLCLLVGMMNTASEDCPYYVGDKMKIRAIVNWFGVADLEKVYPKMGNGKLNYLQAWLGYSDRLWEISEKYSPIHYVTSSTPPILSIHGTDDTMVPVEQSEMLHAALDKVHIRNRLLAMPGGRHSGFTDKQFTEIYRSIFSFLDEAE